MRAALFVRAAFAAPLLLLLATALLALTAGITTRNPAGILTGTLILAAWLPLFVHAARTLTRRPALQETPCLA